MVRKTVEEQYKSWLDIRKIELSVGNYVVDIDADYIGLFEMSGFSEAYINCMDTLSRIRKVGYVYLEIHESQIGEIELLLDHMDIYKINVVFRDGHMEIFNVPELRRMRVTSLGDLRIEMGEMKEESEMHSSLLKVYKDLDYSSNLMYPKNWITGTLGLKECINGDRSRTGYGCKDIDEDMTSYLAIIDKRRDALKDILGEIVSCYEGKKLHKEKIIALATIVDYNLYKKYKESIDIKKYTAEEIDYEENKRHLYNTRVEQFRYSDYAERFVSDYRLKNIIHEVCNEYKDKKINDLLDIVWEMKFEHDLSFC